MLLCPACLRHTRHSSPVPPRPALANRQEPHAASQPWDLASDTMSDLPVHLSPPSRSTHACICTLQPPAAAITSPCSLPPFVPPCLPTRLPLIHAATAACRATHPVHGHCLSDCLSTFVSGHTSTPTPRVAVSPFTNHHNRRPFTNNHPRRLCSTACPSHNLSAAMTSPSAVPVSHPGTIPNSPTRSSYAPIETPTNSAPRSP
jgi:hypothetical protein